MDEEKIVNMVAAAIEVCSDGTSRAYARAALAAIKAAGMIVVPSDDYKRLLIAAEADDSIIWCDTCGAWIDIEDPARATTDDYTGCWKVAAAEDDNGNNCRSYRAMINAYKDEPTEQQSP